MSTRKFSHALAIREQVPLVLGLMGPSGGGKTRSGLRLACGIQRLSGGEIFVIDTEGGRAAHYASEYRFQHLRFGAPFSPLDYLAAIDHCCEGGAKIIIVDSMSHEHEGPGGVLEMHEAEMQTLAAQWGCKVSATQMAAWAKPKAERRRLINSILQRDCHFIFCFRAKEKLKVIKGKEPEPRGFMPQAGEEFIYEMGACALLPPNSRGVPQWTTEYPDGEGLMIKLPDWAAAILTPGGQPAQLTEDMGEQLAVWAAGGPEASAEDLSKALADIAKAKTIKDVNVVAVAGKKMRWTVDAKAQVSAAIESKRGALRASDGAGK